MCVQEEPLGTCADQHPPFQTAPHGPLLSTAHSNCVILSARSTPGIIPNPFRVEAGGIVIPILQMRELKH